jgi:glutamate N-acetyltransferase/amino-acid N-acetyltransferase
MNKKAIQALNPAPLPADCEPLGENAKISDLDGFRTAAVHCGLKTASDKPSDIGLIVSENGAIAAAVFTKNRFVAAPVIVSKSHLKAGSAVRAIIVNAGNANCATGERGLKDARDMCARTANEIGCDPTAVLVASTGVIGRVMPIDKILSGIDRLCIAAAKKKSTGDFSKAILTTDLVVKRAGILVRPQKGQPYRIIGCAKGSGMIAPNLGTMLTFIATDVRVERGALQRSLASAATETFNCATVDGDTSTNDSAFLLSNEAGRALAGSEQAQFDAALKWVCGTLAAKIVADGEGATRTMVVCVGGAKNDTDARAAAYAIAHSPLVKTALSGGDPNWGRIAAAAGRSGAVFSPDELSIMIGGVDVLKNGEPTGYDVRKAARAMSADVVLVSVTLGRGNGEAHFLTCDLAHGYVTINADYHT